LDASLLQPHLRAYAEHGWKGFSADVKASLCKVGSKVALQKWFYAQTKRQLCLRCRMRPTLPCPAALVQHFINTAQ